MKEKVLSLEEIRAMNEEFMLPDEEGFYQYILEDDYKKMLEPEDNEFLCDEEWDEEYDYIVEFEREQEERRHYGRYKIWLRENGINSEGGHYLLDDLFYKIDYYCIGGSYEPDGHVNSHECDRFFLAAPSDIKRREIIEEYNLRKFEALKSISPDGSDEEIEKFLYLYVYNSKEFHLPTEIQRVRDYIQSEEHINDFRFTRLSDILRND